MYLSIAGETMLRIIQCIAVPDLSRRVCGAAAVAMLSAVTACGGSGDGAASATRVSAVSRAEPGVKLKPDLPDAASGVARRATPFSPIANSMNPAMQKLARLQCIKRAKISPGVDKVRYPAATTQDLNEDNCKEIMAVQPG
jgi:hypothetical protein